MPSKATDEMVARIRDARPETPLLYSVQPGDHGFDFLHGLDEPYIAEGIEFVTNYWPRGRVSQPEWTLAEYSDH
jgi:hypothetical protein